MEEQTQPKTEEFKINAKELLKKIEELLKKGTVQKIIIKNEEGEIVAELPVTIALLGGIFSPMLIIAGTLAALLTDCTIVVQHKPSEEKV